MNPKSFKVALFSFLFALSQVSGAHLQGPGAELSIYDFINTSPAATMIFGPDIENGGTILHYMIKWDKMDEFWYLMGSDRVLNERDFNNVEAQYRNRIVGLEERNYFGRTALHVAVNYDQIDITRILLDAGADINAVDSNGATPLRMAIAQNSLEMVRLLLAFHADIQSLGQDGDSILHFAIKEGRDNFEMIELLIQGGCDVNAADSNDSKVLDCAVGNGRMDVARLLVSKGATSESFDGSFPE